MDQVHHEGLKRVIAVMAENDRVAAFFAGDAIENAPAQARTERAERAVSRDLVGDNGIGVFGLDPVGHAGLVEPVGQDMFGETGLALIEIAGE